MALITRLTTLFGEPTRKTKKLVSWTITPSFGIAVQIDSPSHNEFAWLWVPASTQALDTLQVEKYYYAEDKGRHSNTYQVSSLEKGVAVVRIKIINNSEMNDFITLIGE